VSHLNLFSQEKRKKASKRNDRIAAQLRECFSFALIQNDFPIIPNHEDESKLPVHVTITYVNVSSDLRHAIVYFTPLGGNNKEESLKFFEVQKHYFKNLIAKKMKMKYIPEISFRIDETIDYSRKIDQLIDRI
jgi:ribosome-binding factor A